MMIRCPKCERVGHLPDRLAPEARSLRCRKCKENFSTTELAVKAGGKQRRATDDSWRGAALETPGAGQSRRKAAPFLADGLFGRFGDPAPPLRTLGPGDSNYEMTFSIDDARKDSGVGWDKDDDDLFETEAPSSDEIEAIIPGDPASLRPDRRSYGFMVARGRTLCLGVLGFVAISVVLIGFLVASNLGMIGGRVIPESLQALIVASVGTIALLLIGASMIFQSVFLAELVRSAHNRDEPENTQPGR
jgi:hypothetical protein